MRPMLTAYAKATGLAESEVARRLFTLAAFGFSIGHLVVFGKLAGMSPAGQAGFLDCVMEARKTILAREEQIGRDLSPSEMLVALEVAVEETTRQQTERLLAGN